LRPYFLSAATIGRLARRGNEIKEGIGEPLLQKKNKAAESARLVLLKVERFMP